MNNAQAQTKFPAKSKIYFSAALLLIVALIVTVVVVMNQQSKVEVEETYQAGPREISTEEYTPPVYTDPQYAPTEPGTGIQGPEKPELEGDSSYFAPLYLPYIDVVNLSAGWGFNVIVEDMNLTPGATYTANVYSRGQNASAPEAFEVSTGTVDSEGNLEFIVSLPTNLSLGGYTLGVDGPDDNFETNFNIRPAQS